MDRESIVQQVIAIIRRHLAGECKILLFGSWAQGSADEHSDIDIAILAKEKVPWDVMSSILFAVDEIPTLRSIDVVDLNAADETFRNIVLHSALRVGDE